MSSLCLVIHRQWMLSSVPDFNSNPSGASGDPVFHLSRSIQSQRKHEYLTSTIHAALISDYVTTQTFAGVVLNTQPFKGFGSVVKLGSSKDYFNTYIFL